jgi:hypothetical protein
VSRIFFVSGQAQHGLSTFLSPGLSSHFSFVWFDDASFEEAAFGSEEVEIPILFISFLCFKLFYDRVTPFK